MQHEALLYSLDHTITKQQLQDKEDISYDRQRYAKMQERVDEEQIHAIFASEYPRFSGIKPQPYVVYYLGDITLLDKPILGIVGPRKMSEYGKKVVETLFSSAEGYDLVTVSGMAEGVDQLCHQLSCQQSIPTIAVLGWGLGFYYKKPEWNIIQQIVAAWGLVLSEFRLLEKPAFYTFPQRNRIIAGLSDCLFLPEAGEKSWSLITVDFALAMKKPVYATPSSIFSPTSQGILHLMETGQVKPVINLKYFLHQHFSSRDIISRPSTLIDLTDEERLFIEGLSHDQGTSLETLAITTGKNPEEMVQLLTMLEIKGVVAQERPGEYVLT